MLKPPDATGLVRARKHGEGLTWWERALQRGEDLLEEIEEVSNHDVDVLDVRCEMPIFFGGTSGGVAAAESNSLQKLCFLVGVYGRTFGWAGSQFEPVTVAQWKGQLPKEVVCNRIKALLGHEHCEERGYKADIWDAIGIGLYCKGVFK